MGRYLTLLAAFVAALALLYTIVLLNVRGLPEAEYWEREAIVVKQSIASRMSGPKVILLGGSGVLFGFDAKATERAIRRPTVNMGLLGGMRLDRVLSIGSAASRPGDLIVVSLERQYYPCDATSWTPWQIRNMLAWDRPYFVGLPLRQQLEGIFIGANPWLPFEMVSSAIRTKVTPGHYRQRLDAMVPPSAVVSRFDSGNFRQTGFHYSAYNLDDRGDIIHSGGSLTDEPASDGSDPGAICPAVLDILKRFVADMHARGTAVVFIYPPYLVGKSVAVAWHRNDETVQRQLRSIGSTMLEPRNRAFFPRDLFFNSNGHLNEQGRTVRTARLISYLQRIVPANGAAVADRR